MFEIRFPQLRWITCLHGFHPRKVCQDVAFVRCSHRKVRLVWRRRQRGEYDSVWSQYDCDTRISVARQTEREKVGKGFLHHTLTNLTKSKYCFWTWLLHLIACSMHLDSCTPDVRLLAGYAVLAAKQAAIGFWGIANNAFISFFWRRNWKSMELVKICELVVKLFTLLLCFNSLPSKSNKRL